MTNTLPEHTALVANLKRVLQARESDVELIETHISSVLLAGGFAYKIKKPLDLGFLDFSTPERRALMCREEVRLNSRLAPDIYLDVVAITGSEEDPRLGGPGEVIEYAVRMRRFPQAGLLSTHPERLTPQVVDELVRRLVEFHGQIARVPVDQPYGNPSEVLYPMRQNFEQIRALPGTEVYADRLNVLEEWTQKTFERLRARLEQRKAEGFIRECHGDLHLGNIALEDGRLIIFDGIEFNPSLRWIDVMSELAFLLMDMEEKGCLTQARRLLNGYLESSGDYQGMALLRFYQVYRAMVRAKVSAIRAGQPGMAGEERAKIEGEISAYLDQALAYTRIISPALLITLGLSGSGKSTLAGGLVESLAALRLRSDLERKRMLGLQPEARTGSRPGGGIYTAELTERTYARLLELAEGLLENGFSAVVDATFLKRKQRLPFQQLASRRGVPFVILALEVPEAELRARVVRRRAQGGDPSEADLKVLDAQIAGMEPLNDEEQRFTLRVTPDEGVDPERLKALLSG